MRIRVKVKTDLPDELIRDVGCESARAVGFGPMVGSISLHGPNRSVEINLVGNPDEVIGELADMGIKVHVRIRSLVELCQAADRLGVDPDVLAMAAQRTGRHWRALVQELDQGLVIL